MAALAAIDGRLPIPTPALCAVGELEGWSYVLMQRLPGESLGQVWPLTSPKERLGFASMLGESLATLHHIRAPDLPAIRVDWSQVLRHQRATCVERQ